MRFVIGLIALYLMVDFFDPDLPGAFNFNAEESVEAVRAPKTHLTQPSSAIEPQRLNRVDTYREFANPVVNAVVVWATPASRQWRRMLPQPRVDQPASEEASPVSLAA